MDNNKRKHEWNVIVKLGQRDRPTTGWRRWLRKAPCCDWMDPYFLPFRPQNHEDKQEHFGAHESRKWVSHVDDRLHTLYGLVGTDFAFVCQVGGRTLLILLLWMCNEVSDCVIPPLSLPLTGAGSEGCTLMERNLWCAIRDTRRALIRIICWESIDRPIKWWKGWGWGLSLVILFYFSFNWTLETDLRIFRSMLLGLYSLGFGTMEL